MTPGGPRVVPHPRLGAAATQTPRGGFGGRQPPNPGGLGGRETPRERKQTKKRLCSWPKAGCLTNPRKHYRCLRNKRPSKPYEFISFGAMDVTKPYEFIGFGAMDVTKPYTCIKFGARDVTKPYKFRRFGANGCHQTLHIYRVWGHGCHQSL